jgi:hypothetical protein
VDILNVVFNQLLPETTPLGVTVPEFLFVLGMSFALAMLIGWVYQFTYRGDRYSQDYVHTLVIMGTVVSLVIMLVGDNMARAFGVFAVFSIIRFRRNVPEARALGFIFFAMAVGLATGAQEYLFATLTAVLVSLVVLVISHFDCFAPERTSHILRVQVPDDVDYETVFAEPFEQLLDRVTLRSAELLKTGDLVDLRFEVSLRPGVTPRMLIEALKAVNNSHRIVLTSVGEADVDF